MTKKEKQETEKHEQTPAPVAEDQVQKLAQEVLHWKDLALRTAAECENIKKRCALDMQNTARYATKDFAKDLLPVADNLARAIHQAQVEMGKSDKPCDPFFINLLQGVELTQKQLLYLIFSNWCWGLFVFFLGLFGLFFFAHFKSFHFIIHM